MIAKACTAQDDIIGDGTTSTVLLIGEMLKQADIQIQDGLHPRLIAEGFDLAKVRRWGLGYLFSWPQHIIGIIKECKVIFNCMDAFSKSPQLHIRKFIQQSKLT